MVSKLTMPALAALMTVTLVAFEEPPVPQTENLRKMAARFAPTGCCWPGMPRT